MNEPLSIIQTQYGYTGKQAQVAEFHYNANSSPDPHIPTQLTQQTAYLRFNLIREELEELAVAMGVELDESFKPVSFHPEKWDMVEVIDAGCDLDYVVNGLFCAIGVDNTNYWNEVHASNMSKFIDGHRNEAGKWCKNLETYSPANIKGIYEQYMENIHESNITLFQTGNNQ